MGGRLHYSYGFENIGSQESEIYGVQENIKYKIIRFIDLPLRVRGIYNR
jgi:hypothetical protein